MLCVVEAMVVVWSQFALCVALIWFAGVRLSRYGDIIAEKANLSRTWVGVILLATVTSLPELATGISAVALVGAPNIAVGDILGSCVFNLMIITVLDFLNRSESVFTRASQGHILSAGFGVILIGFVGFTLLLHAHGVGTSFGHVGVSTPIIVVLYLIAIRTVFRYERRQRAAYVEEAVERYPDVTLPQAVRRYATAAVVIVGTGTALPFVADEIAAVMGWQRTFVATLFVACATSVPEVAVSIAALRMGALDMAIGNLFGSNLFNIALVAVDDVFYLPGPLLAHASPLHVVSSISAMMMSGIAIVGLLYRPQTRPFQLIGWASFWLLSLYLLNAYLLYLYAE